MNLESNKNNRIHISSSGSLLGQQQEEQQQHRPPADESFSSISSSLSQQDPIPTEASSSSLLVPLRRSGRLQAAASAASAAAPAPAPPAPASSSSAFPTTSFGILNSKRRESVIETLLFMSESHKKSSSDLEAIERLGEDYEPGPHDVICARGKRAWDHAGNVRFRALLEERGDEYRAAKTKLDKTLLVSQIMEAIEEANPPGRFIKQDDASAARGGGSSGGACWVTVGLSTAREKVGQGFRDLIQAKNRASASKQQKKSRRVGPGGHLSPTLSQNAMTSVPAIGESSPSSSQAGRQEAMMSKTSSAHSAMSRESSSISTTVEPPPVQAPPLAAASQSVVQPPVGDASFYEMMMRGANANEKHRHQSDSSMYTETSESDSQKMKSSDSSLPVVQEANKKVAGIEQKPNQAQPAAAGQPPRPRAHEQDSSSAIMETMTTMNLEPISYEDAFSGRHVGGGGASKMEEDPTTMQSLYEQLGASGLLTDQPSGAPAPAQRRASVSSVASAGSSSSFLFQRASLLTPSQQASTSLPTAPQMHQQQQQQQDSLFSGFSSHPVAPPSLPLHGRNTTDPFAASESTGNSLQQLLMEQQQLQQVQQQVVVGDNLPSSPHQHSLQQQLQQQFTPPRQRLRHTRSAPPGSMQRMQSMPLTRTTEPSPQPWARMTRLDTIPSQDFSLATSTASPRPPLLGQERHASLETLPPPPVHPASRSQSDTTIPSAAGLQQQQHLDQDVPWPEQWPFGDNENGDDNNNTGSNN